VVSGPRTTPMRVPAGLTSTRSAQGSAGVPSEKWNHMPPASFPLPVSPPCCRISAPALEAKTRLSLPALSTAISVPSD
jgi:hypothetical protein